MDNFWVAIVGAVVGGIFPLLGGWFSYRWQQKVLEKKEQKTLRNALCAVKLEFEEFWASYKQSLNLIEKQYPEEKNEVVQFIRQEHFTVYKSNISLFSQLQDEELQRLMIRTHMAFRALLDKIDGKNMTLERIVSSTCMFINSSNPIYKQQAEVLSKDLEKQAIMLEASCKEIDELMDVLLPKLDKTIQSLQC